MITFQVRHEATLWHNTQLFESSSIVSAWLEWWRLWNMPVDEYDEGLELALYVNGNYHETLYYEEWDVKESKCN